MKEFIKRLLIIQIIFLLLINYSSIVIISTALENLFNNIDLSNLKSNIEISLEKYENFTLDEENRGVITKIDIKTNINQIEEKQSIIVKENKINISMAKINNEYPETIEVLGISTRFTNGSVQANEYQFDYYKENGKLEIDVLNNKLNMNNECSNNYFDEFKIISYYSKNCYDENKDSKILTFFGKNNYIISDSNQTDIKSEIEEQYEVKENIGGLATTNVEITPIYNGFIKSNIKNNTNYRTEYTERVNIEIDYKEIADEIILENTESFMKNNEIIETDEIILKDTKISKDNIIDLLRRKRYIKNIR